MLPFDDHKGEKKKKMKSTIDLLLHSVNIGTAFISQWQSILTDRVNAAHPNSPNHMHVRPPVTNKLESAQEH